MFYSKQDVIERFREKLFKLVIYLFIFKCSSKVKVNGGSSHNKYTQLGPVVQTLWL